MSIRVEVPQELQKEIVRLYTQEKLGFRNIKHKLNEEYGESIIKRVLRENNVKIRTQTSRGGGRKKQPVDQELQVKIINAYNQGYGLERIVKELSLPFGFDKVRSILIDNGVQLRTMQEAAQTKKQVDLRKYTVNDNYNFETHNGAWLLGFIAADGYLPNTRGAANRVIITLARQDENVLELIKQEIGYSGPLYQFDATGGYPSSSLSFTSSLIRRAIEGYGIGNNKTFNLLSIPNLPEELIMDFIRGFFDGDGSLYEPKGKKINMSFTCASKPFLQDIANYLHDHCGTSQATIHSVFRVHEVFDIKYSVRDSLNLGDRFYCNDFLALPRKKQHYLAIKEKYSIR